MYYGEYQTTLDEKGRITVPSRFRELMKVLNHHVWYMARGFDGAVALYNQEEWSKLSGEFKGLAVMDVRALDFRRLFFGSVAEVQWDQQGRMAVPAHLRAHGGLEREVVVLGLGDHLELWGRARWDAFLGDKGQQFKEMASALFSKQQDASGSGPADREN